MTPLEAAKRLAEHNGQGYLWDNCGGHMGCSICDEDDGVHAPDCPVAALPQIVAALEAAERLTSKVVQGGRCMICSAWLAQGGPHEDRCYWQVLVAAMKGEKEAGT